MSSKTDPDFDRGGLPNGAKEARKEGFGEESIREETRAKEGDNDQKTVTAGQVKVRSGSSGTIQWPGLFSRDSPLNQPVIIVVATALIQLFGWKRQQRQIVSQNAAAAAAARADSTVEDVVTAVGKRLTANSIIVGAHEARVETKQLVEAIDRFHSLQREWDLGEDLLDYHLHVSFLYLEYFNGCGKESGRLTPRGEAQLALGDRSEGQPSCGRQ